MGWVMYMCPATVGGVSFGAGYPRRAWKVAATRRVGPWISQASLGAGSTCIGDRRGRRMPCRSEHGGSRRPPASICMGRWRSSGSVMLSSTLFGGGACSSNTFLTRESSAWFSGMAITDTGRGVNAPGSVRTFGSALGDVCVCGYVRKPITRISVRLPPNKGAIGGVFAKSQKPKVVSA